MECILPMKLIKRPAKGVLATEPGTKITGESNFYIPAILLFFKFSN